MTIKAVLFDLGFTLMKTASFSEIYHDILERYGIEASVEDITWALEETENQFYITDYNADVRKEFWTQYNTSVLERLGIKENTVFLASQIDELWWEYSNPQLYPDVEPMLSELKAKGFRLGLVSNGFEQDLEHVLDKLNLKKWFDTIVCIDSCECAKPDKEIFLYALNKLKVKPHETIFVGDSVVFDYEGARNAGIKSVLIDREGKFPSSYNTITSLVDLLTLV